ncbi:hypothetical protein V8C35DRAFT_223863 [Trichoderma chlorosporum]
MRSCGVTVVHMCLFAPAVFLMMNSEQALGTRQSARHESNTSAERSRKKKERKVKAGWPTPNTRSNASLIAFPQNHIHCRRCTCCTRSNFPICDLKTPRWNGPNRRWSTGSQIGGVGLPVSRVRYTCV